MGPWNSELLQYGNIKYRSRRPATVLHSLYSDASEHGISYRSEWNGISKCALSHSEMVRCLSAMLIGIQDGTRHDQACLTIVKRDSTSSRGTRTDHVLALWASFPLADRRWGPKLAPLPPRRGA